MELGSRCIYNFLIDLRFYIVVHQSILISTMNRLLLQLLLVTGSCVVVSLPAVVILLFCVEVLHLGDEETDLVQEGLVLRVTLLYLSLQY